MYPQGIGKQPINKINNYIMSKRHRITLICAISVFIFSSPSWADLISKELKFRGETQSASTKDTVKASDQHRYEFLANPGQTLKVSISSKTKNIAFGLYLVSPSLYIGKHNDDGDVSFRDALNAGIKKKPAKEEPTKTPGKDIERTKWSGSLPAVSKSAAESGAYAVVVYSKQVDGRYVLKITIE